MLKRKLNIKIFATNVAISFFLASIFITCLYFIGEEKINYYTSLINTFAVSNTNTNRETIYDEEAKRIIKSPEYGKRYGTIKIPSIDLSLPLYFGDNLKILRYGIGQYAGSYFPGEGGSTVLAGHNNVGIFNRLDEVKIGDKVIIEANYGTFTYVVTGSKVVKETDLAAFPIVEDKEMLVMYTCWPINRSVVGRKTERLVVYADRIGDNNE